MKLSHQIANPANHYALEMIVLRSQGWALRAIAARFDCTAEWVRLVLRDSQCAEEWHETEEQNRAARQQALELTVWEARRVRALWLDGLEIAEILRAMNAAGVLGKNLRIRALIAELGADRVLRAQRRQKIAERQHGDRTASEVRQRVARRFGKNPKYADRTLWPQERIVEALTELFAEHGPLSIGQYQKIYEQEGARGRYPSVTTVRNHWRWSDITATIAKRLEAQREA